MSPSYMQRAATRIGIPLAEYQRNRERGLKWCFAHRDWHDRADFEPSDAYPDGRRNECREAVNARQRAAMRRLYWRRKGVAV